MKILISGSSGFVGGSLVEFFEGSAHEVFTLVRSKPSRKNEIFWSYSSEEVDHAKLEGMDAVIHLCGVNVTTRRWSKDQKEKIYSSRISSTDFLVRSLNNLKNPPKCLLVASAKGFYGNCDDDEKDETASKGDGFLPFVVDEWEKVSQGYKFGRVINMRFGLVLGRRGGILKKTLPLYRLGLGAVIGDGSELISWIGIEDLKSAVLHLILSEKVQGAVNFVTPNPIKNYELANSIAKTLGRPLFLKIPRWLIHLVFGQMGKEVLLESSKITPKKLLDSGFTFKHDDLKECLQSELECR